VSQSCTTWELEAVERFGVIAASSTSVAASSDTTLNQPSQPVTREGSCVSSAPPDSEIFQHSRIVFSVGADHTWYVR